MQLAFLWTQAKLILLSFTDRRCEEGGVNGNLFLLQIASKRLRTHRMKVLFRIIQEYDFSELSSRKLRFQQRIQLSTRLSDYLTGLIFF